MTTLFPLPEPCVPSNVSSQLNCGADTAQVSWDPSPNAVSYEVKATSSGQNLTCNSTSPSCTLSNLHCNYAYDIVVTATDGTCVSNYSAHFRQAPGIEREGHPNSIVTMTASFKFNVKGRTHIFQAKNYKCVDFDSTHLPASF